MDFNALRAQTLGSGQDEEAVTVNTRALIDKVLARYSGEWTVLRELLQNAADAGATRVTVKFETIPSATIPLPQGADASDLLKHTVRNHTLRRLVVTNNGQPFNENDWTRLKRIAEGNPDETKIGAFGVGFYSVFADCEEPFVSSGQEAMAFFWKNNALFTRRLKLQDAQASKNTNFVLDYRDTTSGVPPLLPLAQFLANSLTFVGIQHIELWLDEHNILSLTKKTSPTQDVGIPRDIEPKTSEGLMKVMAVTKEVAQIDGEWMSIVGWKQQRSHTSRIADRESGPSLRKFFSRLAGAGIQEDSSTLQPQRNSSESQDLLTKVKATIFLNVDTATIRTFTSSKFNEELERATKKPPPKTTRLAVLTAPYIANDTNTIASVAGDVFASVLPTRSGRIFIGFPTHQTTGLCAHISAPSVIPTVERESIDLNARYVRTWNMEMLRAAGIVCRIAWAAEMASLKSKIVRQANGSKIRMEHVSPMLAEAITTTKNFSFQESTPSEKTGQLLEDAFWTCSKKASIDILSSCGVLPTHEVRVAPRDLSFVEGVPVLPDQLIAEAKPFVDKLVDFGLVTEVTVSDIKIALESTPLNAKQLIEFLEWITKQAGQGKLDRSSIANLMAVAVASDGGQEEGTSQLLILSSIKYFLNPSRIPEQMPVPATVMPFKYTRGFSKHDLELLGWEEFQMVPWMRWLLAEAKNREVLTEAQDLTQSPAFSAQIFPLLSKQWDALSQSSKSSLIDLLSSKTVVPTKLGMKKPADSYFPNVRLFDDLPTIVGIGSVKDKVLVAFGVRKTVELGVVFDRLLAPREKSGSTSSTGSHMALIQYLASVRDDIPSADMQRLRNTPICPKEDKSVDSKESEQRYKVAELYEPRPQLRDLGLPVLAWPGPYRSSSIEGRFLSGLGLRTVPQVPELVEIMARAGATGNTTLRDRALAFFISHHHANGYGAFDFSKVVVPFLPLENKHEELSIPSRCFVDEGALLLGFDLLKRELHAHAPLFGVRRHPPIEQCISILGSRPPTTHTQARALFAYFASRLGEVNSNVVPKLQDMNFVPIFGKNKDKPLAKDFTSPRNCFLGESDTFGEIFNYVDFGSEANAFLLKCGSKPEPSKIEVAQLLVREPARISSTFRNPEKYMALLRSLADSIALLKKNKELFREMKKAPFLLASKEIPQTQPANAKVQSTEELDDFDEELQGIREWQLTSAENAIIVDDYINYNLFKADILAAPQEESLEDFYYALGSPMLSSLVEEAARHGPRSPDQRPAQKLQKQILERSTLFLHEQNPDTIKHDAKWLEKNLTVQLVSSISLRRSLKGTTLSNTQKRTAVITQINREYTLWIAGDKPDLYQVSQALVHVLLTRPKLHSALTLEMLLKTDLLELRARGFNVSRILRQKAAEARLAESKRQQALEEEQKRIEEQQKAWAGREPKGTKSVEPKSKLPGGFPDSPEAKGVMANSSAQSEGEDEEDLVKSAQKWGSNLVRQLGFGRDKQPQVGQLQQAQSQRAIEPSSADPPPPYSQQGNGPRQANQSKGSSVTAPHQLRENLLNAIQKTRPHNSSGIFSRGETNTVSETKSYCDERPAHDLAFVAEIKHGIQMFLPSTSGNNTDFLSSNATGLTAFADVLKVVGADIFNLNPKTLNIFNEIGGKTIAFNRNGSIFCNYLYFKQLHEATLLASSAERGHYAEAEAEAIVYWWVILCHELAHNLVGDHSSDHSYYTEGFVAQYFGKVMRVVGERSGRVSTQPRNLLE